MPKQSVISFENEFEMSILEIWILTITMSFAFDGFFVIVQFVICHRVEWIFSIWCLVNGCIMLIATLDDAFGCGTHQYNMVISTGCGRVLDTICLVPCNALQYVRLWTSRYFVSTSILLDLNWIY